MIQGIAGIKSFRLKVDGAMDSSEFHTHPAMPGLPSACLVSMVLLSKCKLILHTDSQRAAADAAFLIMG